MIAVYVNLLTLTALGATFSLLPLGSYLSTGFDAERYEYSFIEGEDTTIRVVVRSERVVKLLRVVKVEPICDYGLVLVDYKLHRDGDRYLLSLRFSGSVGTHRVRGLAIVARDPFNLINIRAIALFKSEVRVCIIPALPVARISTEVLLAREYLYESALTRRRGLGIDVLGVREYVPGDDFRKIAWKATAKTGRLMVKEFEGRSFRNLVVIVSLHNEHFLGHPPAVHFIARAVVGLVHEALRKGLSVSVGVVTEDTMSITDTIHRGRSQEVHAIFAAITWPLTPTPQRSYASSNRIIRWFTKQVVSEACKEPCIVALFIDPRDDFDVISLEMLKRDLDVGRHELKVFLTPPSIVSLLCSEKVDEDMLRRAYLEKPRTSFAHMLKSIIGSVYAPVEYLQC